MRVPFITMCNGNLEKICAAKNRANQALGATPSHSALFELDRRSANFSTLNAQVCSNRKHSIQAQSMGSTDSVIPLKRRAQFFSIDYRRLNEETSRNLYPFQEQISEHNR